MWVCVANSFDLCRLTGLIFDYVAPSEEKSTSLDMLQTKLQTKLQGKRFLLVLDDIWNVGRDMWNLLRAPLIRGQRGSGVLVTTRHDAVAETIGTMSPVRLQGLSFDECCELFLRCASVNRSISRSSFSDEVCSKLVEKIKGVPLAVKTMGDILSTKKPDHWEHILKGDIWELQQKEGDMLPVLKLSYEDLPPHLKRCFTYCSLFPEDYEFDKLKLVKLWMALDFIQTEPNELMEDVGSSYFDQLLKRSFFQKVDDHYMMHTLYHGLAKSIRTHRCVRITEQVCAGNVQDDFLLHMSLSMPTLDSIMPKLNTWSHLRSFIFIREFFTINDSITRPLNLTDDLLSKLTCLRVLDLSSSSIELLPESVGSLIHLRFLDISQTTVKALPVSISVLYNLQSLELQNCHHLNEIPSGVRNLTNLRHLSASDDLVNTLPGIGKLTSLQELKLFNVSREQGHQIQELENLNNLRGKLCIRNIQNIETKEEAAQAHLERKEHLHELVLEWSTDCGSKTHDNGKSNLDEIENLQPHCNLKILSIIGNDSLNPPSWMNNHMNNLTTIWLRDCRNWKSLPPLGALPLLQYLKIEYLYSVEEVGPQFYSNNVGFPSLEVLELRHLRLLNIWVMPRGRVVFPRLQKLVLEDCPQLENASFPSSLKILKMEKCPKLLMDSHFFQNHPSLHSLSWSFENSYPDLPSCVAYTLQRLSSLEKLEISFCNEMTTDRRWSQRPLWMPYCYSHGRAADEINIGNLNMSIHDGSDIRVFLFYAYNFPDYPDVKQRELCLRIRNYDSDDDHGYNSLSTCLQDHLISLQQLVVKGCARIEALLGSDTISYLKSLKTLHIDGCVGMISLGWFPRHEILTLRLLKIANCPDFITFPLLRLTMLETFQIENCESLSEMDMHGLTSLKCLEILGCSKLKGGSIASRLTVLKELKLRRCPNLIDTLDDMEHGLQDLTSLWTLEISLCENLRQLPRNLQALSSLKNLSIMQCPEIRSLPEPGLPRSLNELRIEGCPLLQKSCQKGGSEWPRVSYIQNRQIKCPTCYPFGCICNQ